MTEVERITIGENNFFSKKYKDYNIKTRDEWFVWKTNREYGETFNIINYDVKNYLSKQKGTGSSTYPSHKDKGKGDNKKYVPPRFDIENLFKFNYYEMFNYKPNKKFNKIYSLVFNHDFYDDNDKNEKYQSFIEIYNEDLMNGNIDKINDICQRLSQYIKDNHICNGQTFVGGSIICNIALMISNYIKTGILDTSIDFICKMDEFDMNEEYNQYCLFLLCQIFTTRPHTVSQYICGKKIKERWKINLIRHRNSDRDMKTKGIVPKFTIINKEINYVLY